VYPSSAVSSWTVIDSPQIKAPATQVIPTGRRIATNALVAKAYSESSEGVHQFKNAVSLLQFKVSKDDIDRVQFQLSGSTPKSYTVTVPEGEALMKDSTYYVSVDAGTYGSGIKVACTTQFDVQYTKTSTKSLNAKLNGQLRLGDVYNKNDKKILYTITETGAINGGVKGFLSNFMDEKYSEDIDTYYNLAVTTYKSLVTKYAPSYDKNATTLDFTYKSVGHDGKAVTHSAYLIYPEGTIKGIILSNHYSILANSDCPTNKLQYEAAFCYKGYAVVMPDNLGFGASSKYPQAYMNAEVTARGDIDALNAAKQLLKDKGVAYGSQTINFGYSQGGHTAMANAKFASEHPEFGVSFTRTFAGGGPYDMEYTWGRFLTGEYTAVVPYILVAIVSYIEGEKLDVDYTDVFQSKYCVPGASNNIKELVSAKVIGTGELMDRVGTSDLTQILTPGMLNGTNEACAKIYKAAKKDALNTGGWNCTSSNSSIYIYHSSEDNYIDFKNMELMATYLKSHGSTPVCRDLKDVYENDFYIQKYNDPKWGILSGLTDEYKLLEVVKLAMDKLGFSIDKIDHVTGAVICAIDANLNHWPN